MWCQQNLSKSNGLNAAHSSVCELAWNYIYFIYYFEPKLIFFVVRCVTPDHFSDDSQASRQDWVKFLRICLTILILIFNITGTIKAIKNLKRRRVEQLRPIRKIRYKVKIILKALYGIHKFSTMEAKWSVSETANWRGHVDEYFAQHLGRNHADLINYFGDTSRSPQFFGSFVNAVVMAHRRRCGQCEFQRNSWERVEQWRPKLQEVAPKKIYVRWILHNIHRFATVEATTKVSKRLYICGTVLDELLPPHVRGRMLLLLSGTFVLPHDLRSFSAASLQQFSTGRARLLHTVWIWVNHRAPELGIGSCCVTTLLGIKVTFTLEFLFG